MARMLNYSLKWSGSFLVYAKTIDALLLALAVAISQIAHDLVLVLDALFELQELIQLSYLSKYFTVCTLIFFKFRNHQVDAR